MRNITYIILHHSATDVTGDGSVLADAIMRYHQGRWKAEFPNYVCDYHYMVGPTGKVFKGQSEEFAGWHATNYVVNLESIGVCFLGNFEKERMSVTQFEAGVHLLEDIVRRYGIKSEHILRHKDVVSDETGRKNSTLCPGRYFPYEEMVTKVFEKESDIPEFVKKLREVGIVVGDEHGNLRLGDFMTREEGFIVAYRILKFLKGF